MSMNVITAFQLLGFFCAYFVVTVLIPHFVLGKSLRIRSRYEKFMIYSVFGNFYVINLVFILQLLHISNTFTLLFFTILPCAIIKIRMEHIPFVAKLSEWVTVLRKIVGGQMGLKAYRNQRRAVRAERKEKIVKHLRRVYVEKMPEVALLVGLFVLLFIIYGVSLFQAYGYKASDLIVHNYWINAMEKNDIFVSGVYPYGFHNMLYFLHAVFGFDTYVLLRIGSFVQMVWIFMILLCFLKCITKSAYLPFIGVIGYACTGIAATNTMSRYYATLPQEYGMIFILPAIYCGFAYFRAQRRENRGSQSRTSLLYLCGFAASFSLTFAVHFYGLFIAAFYCIAMAIGFIAWIFRRPFFKKIVITVFISVGIAILPMMIAVLMGTELQGSLGWGLSVILGRPVTLSEKETINTDGTYAEADDSENYLDTNGGGLLPSTQPKEETNAAPVQESRLKAIVQNFKHLPQLSKDALGEFVISEEFGSYIPMFLGMIVLLSLMGLGFLLSPYRDKCYGAVLLSSGIFLFFMTVLVAAGRLGLPMLMDAARASVYYAYCMPIVFVLLGDGLIVLVSAFWNYRFVRDGLSYVMLLGFLVWFILGDNVRRPWKTGGFETNSAITCLTNIISNEKDHTWTIVSCNDESRMLFDHGYHYETYTFLREQEGIASLAHVRIPTKLVFFFIEKVPIDYAISYEGSGQTISADGALRSLPSGGGLGKYQGENRFVMMSRFYYWAEAFRALYPNEMTVYYETDEFICYRCEQNPYRVFNFAIDYYYNTVGYMHN